MSAHECSDPLTGVWKEEVEVTGPAGVLASEVTGVDSVLTGVDPVETQVGPVIVPLEDRASWESHGVGVEGAAGTGAVGCLSVVDFFLEFDVDLTFPWVLAGIVLPLFRPDELCERDLLLVVTKLLSRMS